MLQQQPPPANVQEAKAFSELMAKAKAMNKKIVGNDRQNLQTGYEMGVVLTELRNRCKIGQWTKALAEMEISRTTAWECLQLTRCSAANISSFRSIRHALGRESKEEEQEKVASPDQPKTSAPSKPANDLCRRCATIGTASCPACKANHPSAPPVLKGRFADPAPQLPICKSCGQAHNGECATFDEPPPDDPLPERQAGDDTEQIADDKESERATRAAKKAAPANGAPVFSLAAFTGFMSQALREIDKLAHGAGLERPNVMGQPVVECPEHNSLARLLESIRAQIAEAQEIAAKLKRRFQKESA